jgi:hypothetical protein
VRISRKLGRVGCRRRHERVAGGGSGGLLAVAQVVAVVGYRWQANYSGGTRDAGSGCCGLQHWVAVLPGIGFKLGCDSG